MCSIKSERIRIIKVYKEINWKMEQRKRDSKVNIEDMSYGQVFDELFGGIQQLENPKSSQNN